MYYITLLEDITKLQGRKKNHSTLQIEDALSLPKDDLWNGLLI